MPAHFRKLALFLLITCLIPLYLISPEIDISFRNVGILTSLMTMPKTAVYKNAGPVFLQDNIGMTGKAWMVEPVAKATAKKKFPNQYLWFGIFPCIAAILRWRCSLVSLSIITIEAKYKIRYSFFPSQSFQCCLSYSVIYPCIHT